MTTMTLTKREQAIINRVKRTVYVRSHERRSYRPNGEIVRRMMAVAELVSIRGSASRICTAHSCKRKRMIATECAILESVDATQVRAYKENAPANGSPGQG